MFRWNRNPDDSESQGANSGASGEDPPPPSYDVAMARKMKAGKTEPPSSDKDEDARMSEPEQENELTENTTMLPQADVDLDNGDTQDNTEKNLKDNQKKLRRDGSRVSQNEEEKMAEETMLPPGGASNVRPRKSFVDLGDVETSVDEVEGKDEAGGRQAPDPGFETFEMQDRDAEAAREEKNQRSCSAIRNRRCLIIGGSVLVVTCVFLLLLLLPSSFVYVDYHEMGFPKSSISGIDYDTVYDYGCYLDKPFRTLVLFPTTAHLLDLKLSVFVESGATMGIDVYLQYFLRKEELASLYKKFHDGYKKVISRKAKSIIKNLAPSFSFEDFQSNRSIVEAKLFRHLRYALSGDCCENLRNDRFPSLQRNTGQCTSSSDCDRGYHVDIGFFQMGAVSLPKNIIERNTRQIVLQLEQEKEGFVQQKAIVKKVTELKVQEIRNKAKEIRKAAEGQSEVIKMTAEASHFRDVEMNYTASLRKIFNQLKVDQEDAKTSLIYLHTLKERKDNLIAFSYNYDVKTLMSP